MVTLEPEPGLDLGKICTGGDLATPGVEKPDLGLQTEKDVCCPEFFRIWLLSGGLLISRALPELEGQLGSLNLEPIVPPAFTKRRV